MGTKHTLEELNNCSREELIAYVLMMQGQLDTLNENIEKLIEQVRLANQYRFGRHTEKLDAIDGQISFFDEAESLCDEKAAEPEMEDVLPSKPKKKKAKGRREEDLKDFPQDIKAPYTVSVEELDSFYGVGNWKKMPDETYKRLRHEPESWTVEIHTVEVYVGTDGDHQDEFLRGKRPKDLLRNSIVTPSLLSSIVNVKYVNSSTLNRVEQEFSRNGVNISRQTMSNWIIKSTDKYLCPLWDRLQEELLKFHVNQSDETPTQVIHDGKSAGSKSYMWVHRSGEFYTETPIVLYEYQKGRDHSLPLEFYRDYKGILVTDSLEQYHLVDKKLPDVTNANCWAHARRSYADAIKAADKKDPDAVKKSVAYQALSRLSLIYKLEGTLKDFSPKERL
ncbi:MAG TPA: transposase, partial [Lachnospiraceae bacterium]|nr:transposase [Lachnospiraceae bacterium]